MSQRDPPFFQHFLPGNLSWKFDVQEMFRHTGRRVGVWEGRILVFCCLQGDTWSTIHEATSFGLRLSPKTESYAWFMHRKIPSLILLSFNICSPFVLMVCTPWKSNVVGIKLKQLQFVFPSTLRRVKHRNLRCCKPSFPDTFSETCRA